jgi:Family of unknown function (DUF6000)
MNPLEQHVAGATVTHDSPFADLQVPVSDQLLSVDIRETWVQPFYFGLRKPHIKEFVAKHLHLVNDELIFKLLASFDWRPRTAGAYLAALSDRQVYTTQIGHLLLRSNVCFAGSAYCIALAQFNSSESIRFLDKYLTHYLTCHDLWFDQGDAMGALAYLDRLNGTTSISRYMDAWAQFVENKSNWNLAQSVARFEESMAVLNELKSNRS